MKNRRRRCLLRAFLLVIMIVCLIPVGQAYVLSARHQKQQEMLRSLCKNRASAQKKETLADNGGGTASLEESAKTDLGMLEKYQILSEKNDDLAGWLVVEGTKINGPVMKSEDDYYLSHNFYKEKDKYGCFYVKDLADVITPGTNFVVYGHNMKDGAMFGQLDKYAKEEFYREHPKILFDTLYEERIYEVMAVFQANISEKEIGFKYYQFYQADTKEEFEYFYENVKNASLYDTGVTAEYGDTFLTLSTCHGNGENERFVVVAKRIEERPDRLNRTDTQSSAKCANFSYFSHSSQTLAVWLRENMIQ